MRLLLFPNSYKAYACRQTNIYHILLTMKSEGALRARSVDEVFRKTDYAEHLKNNPRWSRYKPELINDAEWRHALHADSDGLDNTRVIIRLTELFLERDTDNTAGLSEEETELLYLAAAMQNWGKSFSTPESPGVDISYEFLTSQEIEQRRKKLHSLFDELTPDLDIKKRFIVEKTIYDRTTKLGEVFDAIRRLNCLRTSILAYKQYKNEPDNPASANLGALSLGVLSNQLTHLITYAEKFAPVAQSLDQARPLIEEIFDDIDIRQHPFITPQHVVDNLERAETIWNRSHGDKSGHDALSAETIFSTRSSFEKRFINDKAELANTINSLKSLGLTVVLTSGSFDLLHIGHAKYLERASEFGNILVVGVDSDRKIKARKGESRPIVKEDERVRLLSHIRGVDLLTLKEPEEEKWGLIKLVRPDVLVVTAETYSPEEIRTLEKLYCKRVVVLEPQATTSTGAQIRKIQIGERLVIEETLQRIILENGLSDDLKRELADIALKLRGNG